MAAATTPTTDRAATQAEKKIFDAIALTTAMTALPEAVCRDALEPISHWSGERMAGACQVVIDSATF